LHHILEEKKYGEGGCNKMDDDDEENDDDDDDESLASFIVNDDENNSTCSGSGGNVEQEEESSSEEMVLNHSERSEADCPFELVSGLETGGCSTRFSCPIFKVDEGKRLEAVPLPDLYRYRGKELSKLSRFEHRTQVKVEKKTLDDDDISDDKKSNRGRKNSKGFEFASGFILQPSHVQKLRLKLCTLKLFGNPPPFPGNKPTDKESAEFSKWKKRQIVLVHIFWPFFDQKKICMNEIKLTIMNTIGTLLLISQRN
jgi:hypothetical protein